MGNGLLVLQSRFEEMPELRKCFLTCSVEDGFLTGGWLPYMGMGQNLIGTTPCSLTSLVGQTTEENEEGKAARPLFFAKS